MTVILEECGYLDSQLHSFIIIMYYVVIIINNKLLITDNYNFFIMWACNKWITITEPNSIAID